MIVALRHSGWQSAPSSKSRYEADVKAAKAATTKIVSDLLMKRKNSLIVKDGDVYNKIGDYGPIFAEFPQKIQNPKNPLAWLGVSYPPTKESGVLCLFFRPNYRSWYGNMPAKDPYDGKLPIGYLKPSSQRDLVLSAQHQALSGRVFYFDMEVISHFGDGVLLRSGNNNLVFTGSGDKEWVASLAARFQVGAKFPWAALVKKPLSYKTSQGSSISAFEILPINFYVTQSDLVQIVNDLKNNSTAPKTPSKLGRRNAVKWTFKATTGVELIAYAVDVDANQVKLVWFDSDSGEYQLNRFDKKMFVAETQTWLVKNAEIIKQHGNAVEKELVGNE